MKSLPAIAATAIALALLVSPMVTSAAGTISFSSPNAGSTFKGSEGYTIAGTISPAPSQADQVFIQVKNPNGATVDSASATVNSGAFSYSTAVGGSSAWITGTYTISASDSYGASGSTSFMFTATPPFNQTQWILDIARNQTIIERMLTNIQGNLSAHAAADAQSNTQIQNTLAGIVSSLGSLTSNLNTVSQAVTGLQGSVTSIGTQVGSINTAVQGLGSQVSNAATQATNAANAVGSTQTYVLVVAVLAAITLVLELAILVRKLS